MIYQADGLVYLYRNDLSSWRLSIPLSQWFIKLTSRYMYTFIATIYQADGLVYLYRNDLSKPTTDLNY